MDSRNQKNCTPFPQQQSGNIRVLGNGPFPIYLVRGDRGSALIEAGISATADEVVRGLDRLEVTPDFIVITHPHADHVMGLDPLRERYPGTRVLTGEGAAPFLSHPAAAGAIVAEDRHMATYLAARGYPVGRTRVEKAPDLEDALTCKDGEELDLGGVTLRFLEVRGHSPGNLAVFVPEEKILLESDCLGFCYSGGGFFPVFFTGYREYMATLDRLESLRPEILGLGHHGFIRGAQVGEAFAVARKSAAGLRERLRDDPRDGETVVAEIVNEFYRDELTLYSRENITNCCRLLLRRSLEEDKGC
ncbi:MAG: MBL fold metallo-hydrolase [Deltaproteobacteria bacterium]|nr:MBL fold metallo-hydrolase [Deltaproteobacteria bacterium]